MDSISMKLVSKKRKQMEKCKHLFIKTKDGYWVPGFHSTDNEYIDSTIMCIHCGLTNEFILNGLTQQRYFRNISLTAPYYASIIKLNNELFRKQLKNNYNPKKESTEDMLNMISNESLNTIHPKELYLIAKRINPEADNAELFEIMKDIHEIETDIEKHQLDFSKDLIQDLIKRYNNQKGKALCKTNR